MDEFFIQRVQIEGGFLDGFDLNLKNGLNTIIGARGTGKSTFIELIRYAFNIKGINNDSTVKSLNHALSVLKDGQVILTLTNNEKSYTITRTSEFDQLIELPIKMNNPLIFSQTEIENVGLLSTGRLNIIDSFSEDINSFEEKELKVIAKINTISRELVFLTSETDILEEKLLPLKSKKIELENLELQLNFFSQFSDEISRKTFQLNELTDEFTIEMYKLNFIEDFRTKENKWISQLQTFIELSSETPIWRENDINPFENIIEEKNRMVHNISNMINLYQNNLKLINEKKLNIESKITDIKVKSHELRKEVDSLKNGFGEISRNILHLKNDISVLEKLKYNKEDNSIKIQQLKLDRNILLDELDGIRLERSQIRENICNRINNVLSPKIHINIEFSSQIDDYINILTKGLKGSGIQYTDIVPIIAKSIPPRELINIIENNNFSDFISFISITKNRAMSLINALKNIIFDIATVLLDDKIYFSLNDGTEWKDFSELSTGQRCTVILPIILEHKDTILIIDQPEDHIDNAFIVDTLINSIKRRNNKGQIIITTHNANLPVLGEAEIVAHLESDGKRGFIKASGTLNQINIKDAITSVMEGGKQAFRDRSEFYGI